VALAVGKDGGLFSWSPNLPEPEEQHWEAQWLQWQAIKLGRPVDSVADARVPGLVEGSLLNRIVMSASAGYMHSTVVTEEGLMHTFGRGEQGGLGHGAEVTAFEPG
jgi:alpha-tubulin suppressor-like RCC1 family protein